MTLANKITIARILLIPVFVLLAVYYSFSVQQGAPNPVWRWGAIAVFALAAASDGIDGYIARRFNQRSRLGVILDPIADKGLLLAGVLTLTFSRWSYGFPLWFPVLVITRDLIVVIGALVLHMLNGSVHVRATWAGKCATALQMTAVIVVMAQLDLFKHDLAVGTWRGTFQFADIPVVLAALFTAISGVGYMVDGIAQLQAGGHGDPATHDQSKTSLDTRSGT